MTTSSYGASTKGRERWTHEQDRQVRNAIYESVAVERPATVRSVFYRVVSLGIIDKSEEHYRKIQRRVLDMRRAGVLPYGWITDGTRYRRQLRAYDGLDQALAEVAQFYRRRLWTDSPVHVEVWCEKDALAGVLAPVVVNTWDVPLMVTRGFSSETYLYEAGAELAAIGKPTEIYYIADLDAAGLDLTRQVTERLPTFAPDVPITFERIAVTEEQITELGLITRTPKPRDRKAGLAACVEVDAIAPSVLRRIVDDAIAQHVPSDHLAQLEAVEAEERDLALRLAATFGGAA
jgi:hypothetical protein